MKNSMLAIVVILFSISVVYAQTGYFAFGLQENALMISSSVGGERFKGTFEGKINGKSMGFKIEGATVVINDGQLSDAEMRLIESGIDLAASALSRGKYEMPEMSLKLKAEGKTLVAIVESQRGGASFEGKFEGTINGEPLEFKQDTGGSTVINDDKLSDNGIKAIERWYYLLKSFFGLTPGMLGK